MITDRHSRNHDYLRISLTDVCNLRCQYCMPKENYEFMPHASLMQANEIESIARIFVEQGVTKIRLTGGEPMARKDFGKIVEQLSNLPVALTLTTNATMLHRHIDTLISKGISQLNISLDTLSREKFAMLTRRDLFDRVHQNLALALAAGFRIKVNMVVMKGVNESEVLDFVELTREHPIDLRFIEFMPFAGNHWNGSKVFSKQEILAVVISKHSFTELSRPAHDTSQRYKIPGFQGSFGVISTMSEPFCAGCNRMRLTADGKMKNCLFSQNETDLLSALREGLEIEGLITDNILGKAKRLGGQFGDIPFEDLQEKHLNNRSMISIGG